MDDIAELFGSLSAEPMPGTVRARLEATLLGDGSEAQRMPARLRTRLAATMSAGDLMEELGARPMPAGVRDRLERRLVARARTRLRARALGAAAVVALLVVAGVTLDGSVRTPPDGGFAAPIPTTPPAPSPALPEIQDPAEPGAGVSVPPGIIPGPFGHGAGGAIDRGPAPPYMGGPLLAPGYLAGDLGGSQAPVPPRAPLRVGVITGDPDMERGFRGYIRALNEGGGLLHRTVEVVEVSADAPARAPIAVTVNLSGTAVAAAAPPAWIRGPLLEGLDATEDALTGSVFSTSSPATRQARLIARVMYPTEVTRPTTAVIYRGGPEPFAAIVPDALVEALEARGVTPVVVTVPTNGTPNVLVPADVAFLSLPSALAGGWLDMARARGYEPERGVAGIYSLMDDALAPSLEAARATIISPYAGRGSAETFTSSFGGEDGYPIERAHGWVTAKDLAVAIWRAGHADSTSDVSRALRRSLPGYDSGFAPPYQTRAGSNARTPEGVVYAVTDGRFVRQGTFLRDSG